MNPPGWARSSTDDNAHYMIFEKNEHGAYMGKPLCRELISNEHLNYVNPDKMLNVCVKCKTMEPYNEKIRDMFTLYLPVF